MKRHKKMTEARKRTLEARKRYKSELPLNLIESEILIRLPAKSVGRCMCVCKQWKSYLSTPTFARMHLRDRINDFKLLLLDNEPPTTTFRKVDDSTTTNLNPDPNAEYILASVDGLVCLASRGHGVRCKLAFWNPLTGAYKRLSSFPIFSFSFHSSAVIGFYVDSYNDYKLLYMKMGGRLAYVYSLRLDSWREIVSPIYSNDEHYRWSEATFLGQCLYFTVRDNEYHSSIICFDVNTERFRKIGIPPCPGDDLKLCYRVSLVILNGSLHLCVSYISSRKHSTQSDLWRMDGDDGWVKVAAFIEQLNHTELFTQQHKHIYTTSAGNWVTVLDQENDSFKKMNIKDFIKTYRCFCSTDWEYRSSRMIYVESLVSPNL